MNNTKTPLSKREKIVKKDFVKKKKRKKLRFLLLTLSAVFGGIVFISIVVMINVIMICSKPVVLEVGETPNLSVITEKNSIRGVCRVDSKALNIRTEQPATYKIPIYIFGVIKCDVTLRVIDSKKPIVISRTVNASVGVDIKPEMFIGEITDRTDVKVEIKGNFPVADVAKSQKVSLVAIDIAGNSTEFDCILNVFDSTNELTFAPDVSVRHIERKILNLFPKIDYIDLPKEIKGGIHIFEARSRDEIFYLRVIVTDTTPSTAEVDSFDIIAGNEIADNEPPVIKGYKDITSKVGYKIDYLGSVSAYDDVWGTVKVEVDATSVDLNTAGKYKVKYFATDGNGNRAEVSVNVVIREPIRVCLNVSNIMQKPALPNGCEVVSLAIALKYAGYSISPTRLYDEYMPKSPYKNGDPWTTYVGNAKDLGYGCYAPCVVETGNAYLTVVGSSLRISNVSGQDLSYYRSLIDRGIPVIMWGTVDMNGNSTVCWEGNINGKYVNWHTYSHCLVLIGYTDDTYIFCDPLKGITEYSWKKVEESFALNYRQACIVG